ncbi:MAG: hypothetical protein QM742_01295 [Aquabacterium sp.]
MGVGITGVGGGGATSGAGTMATGGCAPVAAPPACVTVSGSCGPRLISCQLNTAITVAATPAPTHTSGTLRGGRASSSSSGAGA